MRSRELLQKSLKLSAHFTAVERNSVRNCVKPQYPTIKSHSTLAENETKPRKEYFFFSINLSKLSFYSRQDHSDLFFVVVCFFITTLSTYLFAADLLECDSYDLLVLIFPCCPIITQEGHHYGNTGHLGCNS